MNWALILLVFVGSSAFFAGSFLGFFAYGWKRKPPVRAIALAGLALAALSMVFLNGVPAVPSAAVCLFCTGLLFLCPGNEKLYVDSCRCVSQGSLRVYEYVRMGALSGLILMIASLVFINGPAAVLAAGMCYVSGVVFALRPATK